ncbi:MAG: adenylyltransferase/cytidyltransferase family protein, partial [Aestuariivirgaceae bacterium]
MPDKIFDILVFIGRFQPFHLGHQSIVDMALEQAHRVIVFIGSADSARSIKNPFTYQERRDMIAACYGDEVDGGGLRLRPLKDVLYNDTAWIASVQASVLDEVLAAGNDDADVHLHGLKDFRVGLIGHMKDNSGYYQKMFPEWRAVDVKHAYGTFGSTHIREDYLRASPILPNGICPEPVINWLHDFRVTPEFAALVAEKQYIDDYRQHWKAAPYPPIFV